VESRRYAITAQQAQELIEKLPQANKTQRNHFRQLMAAVGGIAGDERLILKMDGGAVALVAVRPGNGEASERVIEEKFHAKLALMYVEKKKIPWE
jgi:hypothetical protein